ncbi:MAG: four helix bundle protein [Patescibacteria group bacterium]
MVHSFLDLKVWQKAQYLAEQIYRITRTFPKDEVFGLTTQLRRSAVSVAANIAESHGRYHYKDKLRSLYISRAEICEIRSHLRIALSQNYINKKDFKTIDDDYDGLTIGINCFIKSSHKH